MLQYATLKRRLGINSAAGGINNDKGCPPCGGGINNNRRFNTWY